MLNNNKTFLFSLDELSVARMKCRLHKRFQLEGAYDVPYAPTDPLEGKGGGTDDNSHPSWIGWERLLTNTVTN